MRKKQLLNKDIFEIFNLFELELYKLQHLPKTEQMKIRKRIDSTLNPTLRGGVMDSPDEVLRIVEDRLYDILKLFRDKDKFIHDLSDMLYEKFLPLEERAFAQLNKLDSKKIRQKLDAVGLSRTSNLRFILTRISRDSLDIKEFLSSVNREAEKITYADEKKILSDLKENKELSFMSDIIQLLLEKVEDILLL